MPKRNNTTNLIHAAIDEACEDRAQFARDNEDCAPEDAREARQVEQEMAAWKHDNLKDGARWTPGSLREKGLAFFDPVCQALYFAIISRTARIIALEKTNAGTGEDVAWRKSYQRLLSLLSQDVQPRKFILMEPRDIIATIPEDSFEEVEGGGRVYRPKL
tara:strand:- start:1606 stop:2085 length:480 start_codon:yes stop_codon:yes gene_type:complete